MIRWKLFATSRRNRRQLRIGQLSVRTRVCVVDALLVDLSHWLLLSCYAGPGVFRLLGSIGKLPGSIGPIGGAVGSIVTPPAMASSSPLVSSRSAFALDFASRSPPSVAIRSTSN